MSFFEDSAHNVRVHLLPTLRLTPLLSPPRLLFIAVNTHTPFCSDHHADLCEDPYG